MQLSYCHAALLLACVAASQCKPKGPTTSQVQSLDNFAKAPTAATTLNYCGTPYSGQAAVEKWKLRIDSPDTASTSAVLSVLTAVPANLVEPFYQLGGKILVSAKAEADCKDTPFSADERDIAGSAAAVPSCWRQPNNLPPLIIVSNNPAQIHQSLLRLFAYVYTEFFVTRISGPAAPAAFATPQWQASLKGFADTRERLAAAFLTDLGSRDRAAYARLARFHTTDASKFGNYVFAEALDSYYCSAAARDHFKSSFQTTWSVFTDSHAPHSPVQEFGG